MINYKGYEIDTISFAGMITVFFEGDEFVFNTVDDAKAFIDRIS